MAGVADGGALGGGGGGSGGSDDGHAPGGDDGRQCRICGRGVGGDRFVCGRRVCRLLQAFLDLVQLLDRLVAIFNAVRGVWLEVQQRRGPDGGGAGGAGAGAGGGGGVLGQGVLGRLFGDGAGGGGAPAPDGGPQGGDGAALGLLLDLLRPHMAKIDGETLLGMSEEDLRRPPMAIPVLGDVKRLWAAVSRLKASVDPGPPPMTPVDPWGPGLAGSHSSPVLVHHHHAHAFDRLLIARVEAPDTPTKSIIKTIIAFAYCCIALLITAFVMVIVHDRVPDMKTYPPLPDLFLDNVPLISWAFDVCEVIALSLMLIWFLVLLFHRHRYYSPLPDLFLDSGGPRIWKFSILGGPGPKIPENFPICMGK